MMRALGDTKFLQQLYEQNNQEVFVRIIAIDYNDNIKESIEGWTQNGSCSLDGSSAVRRSCNISFKVVNNMPITDEYWALNNQFKLEIGLTNNINANYPNIIWFKQGTFVINNFNKVVTTSDLTINISGQDKMCRLNGTVGGKLPEEIDFGKMILVSSDNSTFTKEKVPLYTIIQSSLLEYGGEALDKIIINDLDEEGLELLEYRGEQPLYLIYEPIKNDISSSGGIFHGFTMDPTTPVWLSNSERIKISTISQYYQLNSLDNTINLTATKIAYDPLKSCNCVVIKIEYGHTIGYHSVPLVYAGDLILKSGNALTSVYDKIKTQLGEYEYFYDINGNFIFQKKKTYVQNLFSPISGDIVEAQMVKTPYSYSFTNQDMISNISYSPAINTLKNDFTVWGECEGASGKIPVHVRYAIDIKPTYYQNYEGNKFYYTNSYVGTRPLIHSIKCDWREIIYQMAKDYSKFNTKADFFNTLSKLNDYVTNGKTGYENYYATILGFWRGLYFIGDDIAELPLGYSSQDYFDSNHKYAHWHKNVYNQPTQIKFWFDFLDVGDGPLNKLNKKNCGARTEVNTSKQPASIFQNKTPEILFYTQENDRNIRFASQGYTLMWLPRSVEKLFSSSSQSPSLIDQINNLIYQHCCCQETITLSVRPVYHLEPNTRIYVEGVGDLIVNKISYALGHNSTMTISCTKIVDSIY